MLLAYRLVRLIENRSDQLLAGLFDEFRQCPHTRSFSESSAHEFEERAREIYQHLGEWLLGRSEADISGRYEQIGRRRAEQGVKLSELLCAINLVKEHLLRFLQSEAVKNSPAEVFGEVEILQLLDQFFDRAIYHAAVGYEQGTVTCAGTAGQS